VTLSLQVAAGYGILKQLQGSFSGKISGLNELAHRLESMCILGFTLDIQKTSVFPIATIVILAISN
jgi:hypothetical protein